MNSKIKELLQNIDTNFSELYHARCKFKNFEDERILADYVKLKALDTRISQIRELRDQLDMEESVMVAVLQDLEIQFEPKGVGA